MANMQNKLDSSASGWGISLNKTGGKLDKKEQEFASYLIELSGAKTEEQLQKYILDTGMDKINEIYIKWESDNKNKVMEAKLGSKLNYLMRLQGRCPEGYEIEKFMAGGCVKCRKKAAGSKFEIAAKQRIKKDKDGDTINKNDTVHTSKGVYSLNNKKTPYKKMTPADYRKLSDSEKNKVDLKDQASGRSQAEAAAARSSKIGKKQEGGTLIAFKCGGKAKKRIKKNMGGTVSNKWSIPTDAKGNAIKHIKGGPGSADSTREMTLNKFQKSALKGKPYKK